MLLLLSLCHSSSLVVVPIALPRQAEALKIKDASISITLFTLQHLSWSASPDADQASGTHIILMGVVLVSRCPLCWPVAPFLPPTASGHVMSLPLYPLPPWLTSHFLCLLGRLRWKGMGALPRKHILTRIQTPVRKGVRKAQG